MNKLLAGGLIMFSIFTGCSQGSAPVENPVAVEPGKAAVVYFSWSPDGNTRFAAETIAAKLGAKTFEIKAEKPYSNETTAPAATRQNRSVPENSFARSYRSTASMPHSMM